MRYANIFFLNFQSVFQERARSFVWFLLSLFGPVLMILFWRGADISKTALSVISSYYFILIVGSSFLMSHSEENISLIDIQEGRMSSYLLKPFIYFSLKWMEEIPYRLLQGSFGVMILISFMVVLHIHISSHVSGILNIILSALIVLLGVTISQVYKTCLGFISFWTTDAYGMFQLSELLIYIFAGYIVPISFFPHNIAIFAYLLPFAYIIYFPVASVAGFFTTNQLFLILLGQFLWLSLLSLVYKILWERGIKIFTGVGQ